MNRARPDGPSPYNAVMVTGALPEIEQIVEGFELLDDWDERFEYLIDLGRKLPPMPEDDLVDANKVLGCQASVWMTVRLSDEDPPRMELNAVSDAQLVNGLIAVLLAIYNGRTPGEALAIDGESILRKLDLDDHLSPTRRNGLHAMLKRIRQLARAHAGATTDQERHNDERHAAPS